MFFPMSKDLISANRMTFSSYTVKGQKSREVYLWIVRGKDGIPIEAFELDPTCMLPIAPCPQIPEGGWAYEVPCSNSNCILQAKDVVKLL